MVLKVRTCKMCGAFYIVRKSWQQFCSKKCNDRYQYRYGKSGRNKRLKRKLFPRIGTLTNDMELIMVNGQWRVRGFFDIKKRGI